MHPFDPKNRNSPMAALVSLGCAKNLVDSEAMAAQLEQAGYAMTANASEASLIVVNTCGFIQSAVEEAVETILLQAVHKGRGSCRQLVVAGCMVQRYGKKLLDLFPEVDVFVGASHSHRLGEILGGSEDASCRRLWIGRPDQRVPALARIPSGPVFSRYLKVADGCDNHCSYCMIPRLRGPYRSRSIEDLVQEAGDLAAQGAVELNLVAQDVTAFGSDRGDIGGIEELLEALEGIEGIRWIRMLYAYPDRLRDSLLRRMARSGKIVPYLDLPLQHCAPSILRAMGRSPAPGAGGMEEVVQRIRSLVPGVVLRSTFIVGFPGETEKDFESLMGLVERARLDHVGVFAFSPEAGTRAARLPGQVHEKVKERRRRALLEAQRRISAEKLGAWVGKTAPVLVEGLHPETDLLLVGRLAGQAPEVDGTVIINEGRGEPGRIRPVLFTASHDYDLEGRIVGEGEARSFEG